MIPDVSWMAEAACVDSDPEAFFPRVGDDARPALRVCREACPVRFQCLEYALETGQEDGIWGGVRQDRLRAMRKERRRAKASA